MKRRTRQAAFTLTEMLLAMITLGMIGAAVTGMVLAASNAWQTRDDYRRQIADARSVMATVTEWVRSGRRIVSAPETGGGRYQHLVIWHNDDHFGGIVNLSEVRVITYDIF